MLRREQSYCFGTKEDTLKYCVLEVDEKKGKIKEVTYLGNNFFKKLFK